MTRPNLRVLGTYRDVYSNRNSSSSSNISQPVTRSNTTTGSSHVNNPYVNNFTDTGTQDVTTLVLFILLVTLSACLVLMRLSQYCDGQEEQRREQQNNQNQQQSNQIRTQETIEKMIVLKKVLSASVRDLDLSLSRKGKKRVERRKSNLVLRSNKNGDELDESRTCPICLCEYEDGESICWSHNKQCAHHFHAQCGIAWLAKHTECPICRANYLVPPTDDQKNSNDLPLSEPHRSHVITITEQDEESPENNSETENHQSSLETMEEGGATISASYTETVYEATIHIAGEELHGAGTTGSGNPQVSSSTGVEGEEGTGEARQLP